MRLKFVALSFPLLFLFACGKTQKPPEMDAAGTVAPVADAASAPDAAPATPDAAAANADAAPAAPDAATADGAAMATDTGAKTEAEFKVLLEQFADVRILRYRVPGWNALTPKLRVLLYHFAEASLAMREISWDQVHPQGLLVKRTLEAIDKTYKGDKTTNEYAAFEVYLKRVWFSHGIYHHYSDKKFEPGFSKETFAKLVADSDPAAFPLAKDETPAQLADKLTPLLFDPAVEATGKSSDAKGDLIADSANNFYGRGITQKEVEAFYAETKKNGGKEPPMFGLNSKLVKNADGKLEERSWKVGGMYGAALEKSVAHFEAAMNFVENDQQKAWLESLIKYYKTGDLKDFDAFNIAWVKDTNSTVDLIHGFIETYGDALDMRGSYEAIVQVKDPESSQRIAAISAEAQWFEDNMPYLPQHKKAKVTGISARVIDTVLGTGDSGPAFPIGVNLPNSDWIRREHGSKSISLGNIVTAYEEVKKASGVLEEFASGPEAYERMKKYAPISDKLQTDMHEVIGHASGQLEPGVLTMSDTLKSYASCLEEARADLVALYYMPDAKLAELGLVQDPDIAKAGYEAYVQNALLVQLARIPQGEEIQEAHMRNRHLIAQWAMEKGGPDVIAKIEKAPGKTAFVVKDHVKLRALFGELLKEIQRIKSQGDAKAGAALVETYGVKIDPVLHKEVKERWDKLGVAPYAGFVNPNIVPVEEGGEIVDAKIVYVDDFATQMRDYAARYANLPVEN